MQQTINKPTDHNKLDKKRNVYLTIWIHNDFILNGMGYQDKMSFSEILTP